MADKLRRNFLSTLAALLGGGLAANKVNAAAQLSPVVCHCLAAAVWPASVPDWGQRLYADLARH